MRGRWARWHSSENTTADATMKQDHRELGQRVPGAVRKQCAERARWCHSCEKFAPDATVRICPAAPHRVMRTSLPSPRPCDNVLLNRVLPVPTTSCWKEEVRDDDDVYYYSA